MSSFLSGTEFVIIAFVFGCCIGSFLNVLIWRLPREEGIGGRSHCPKCGHQLNARDLVPLLSFAVARGRCRYCRTPVSWRYPLIEAITGLLFAAAAHQLFPHVVITGLIGTAIALSVCVVTFVIDLEHYLILDRIVFSSYVIFAILIIIQAIFLHNPTLIITHFLAAILSALPFYLLWYFSDGKWMGYGDVKFIALMGLILGWPGILVALFLSFIVGALVGIILILFGKKQLSSKIPFGTFLSLATVVGIFYGPQLWQWYWGLFGLS